MFQQRCVLSPQYLSLHFYLYETSSFFRNQCYGGGKSLLPKVKKSIFAACGLAAASLFAGSAAAQTGYLGAVAGAPLLTTPLQHNGELKLGNTTVEADRKRSLLKFGDGEYVRIGEFEKDDILSFAASGFNFKNTLSVGAALGFPSSVVHLGEFHTWGQNNTGYQSCYIGFNMKRENGGWTMLSSGGAGGGAAIFADRGGSLFISTMEGQNKLSTWTATDQQVVANARLKIGSDGTVYAKAVKVTLAGPWPDYVFAKGYALPSLEETAAFIQKNGHLPNIPAAAAIQKDGIDLGEMNRLLLEKVEEMTLQMIEMKREIEGLKNGQDKR